MTARIVFVPPAPDLAPLAQDLVPSGFDLTIIPQFADPGLGAALADARYLICYPNPALNERIYRAAPQLKLIQLLSAGYDAVDLDAARDARVPVANNGGANATSVAEHALMMMLAVSRRLVAQHINVAGGRWRGNDPPRIYELAGRTLGIVGLGTIGKKTARLARAFGLTVQYFDIVRLTEDAEDSLGVRFRLLGELLKTSDIVSLHVPLNGPTRHMIGAAELASMKDGAILINTARGRRTGAA